MKIVSRRALAGAAGLLLALVLIVVMTAPVVMAQGGGLPFVQSFYGNVTEAGVPATQGTVITAKIGGVPYGSGTVDSNGQYGMTSPFRVGAPESLKSQTIDFYVGGQVGGTHVYNPDLGAQEVNLAIGQAPTLASIAVTPASPGNLTIGNNLQFTATGNYTDSSTADITSQVTWNSSNTGVATVTINGGLANGVAAGTTDITASLSGVISNTVHLTVVTVPTATLTSIAVTPATPGNLTVGHNLQFTATGNYTDSSTADITSQVTWNSSNTSAATITLHGGLATAVAAGTTSITASLSGVTSNTVPLTVVTVLTATLTSIAVTPTSPGTLTVGNTLQFTATGHYSDSSTAVITSQVTWNSSSTGVATIVTGGLATAVAAGTTSITASLSGITSTPVSLTVQSGSTGGGSTGGGVVTTPTPTATHTPTPTATPVQTPPTIPTPAPIVISGNGTVTQTIVYSVLGGQAVLTIGNGTTVHTAAGGPLQSISVVEICVNIPQPQCVVGCAYDYTPNGATFSPPVTLTLKYDPGMVPSGVDASKLVIAYYDTATSKWVALPSTVDTVNHTVTTTQVIHFTLFAVYSCAAAPTPTPTVTVGPTPTPTPTPTPAAGGKKTNIGVIIGPIIIVIIIALVAYWFWMRRKRGKPPAPTEGPKKT